jgi:hypothetical protein
MGDMTVTGTRPSSARDRPQLSHRSHNPYHKVSSTSQVDETLFGKGPKTPVFPPPWDKKDNRGQMLLWSPSQKKEPNSSRPTPVKSNTPRKLNNKSRLIKYKESYVDESLFGPKLKSSFRAPWDAPSVTPEPHLANPMNYSDRVQAEKRLNATNINGAVLQTRPLSRQDFRPSSGRAAQPTSNRPGSGRSPFKVPRPAESDYWPLPSGISSVASTARPAWR